MSINTGNVQSYYATCLLKGSNVNTIYFLKFKTNKKKSHLLLCWSVYCLISTSCLQPCFSFLFWLHFLSFPASFHYLLILSNCLSHSGTEILSLISSVPRSFPSPSLLSSRSVWRHFRSQTHHELWSPQWDINREKRSGTLRPTPKRDEGGK